MQNRQSLASEDALVPCNLCGNTRVSILASRGRSGSALRTVICKQCGLVWSDPFPHEPRHFYENEYRLEYKNTFSPKPKHILRAGKIALNRYEKIKHLLSSRQTILDVGTGGGEFAYLLKSLGHNLHGIEPNKGYAEYSVAEYDLNLQIGFIQECSFKVNAFDVITIWHVLEHTEDPFLVLSKLQSLLNPQGILIVEVPNIEAVCQSPKSTFHEAHLFNFNLNTLTKLGEKAGLIAENHLFSEDGGNVTIFFHKAANGTSQAQEWSLTDNAERILSLIKGHNNCKHYLSAVPYQRFLQRMYRTVAEKVNVKDYESNKLLLDDLYRNCINKGKV